LVYMTFITNVHRGVQMGFKGIDESLYLLIAPRLLVLELLGKLQRPTAINTNGSKSEGLVGFGVFLESRNSYRFRLPGLDTVIFTTKMCAIHFACDLIESK
jgi:hypothetical protein